MPHVAASSLRLKLCDRKVGIKTYLHDELDRTDEISEELENQIFLLFLHLIHSVLLATEQDFMLSQTDTRVSLKLVFWHDATLSRTFLLLFLLICMTILRLQLINQCIHVLIFLFLFLHRLLSSRGGSSVIVMFLLIKL